MIEYKSTDGDSAPLNKITIKFLRSEPSDSDLHTGNIEGGSTSYTFDRTYTWSSSEIVMGNGLTQQDCDLEYGYEIPKEDVGDLNSETESLACRYAMDEYNCEFIFITDFSAKKRAFYHSLGYLRMKKVYHF